MLRLQVELDLERIRATCVNYVADRHNEVEKAVDEALTQALTPEAVKAAIRRAVESEVSARLRGEVSQVVHDRVDKAVKAGVASVFQTPPKAGKRKGPRGGCDLCDRGVPHRNC